MVHQQQQNYSAAVPFYRRAIQLRPQLAVAYLNLATTLLACNHSLGHEEAAIVLLTGARLQGRGVRDRNAHVKARHSAYLQLAALHRSGGKLQQAVEVLQEGLSMPQSVAQRAVLHQRLVALHMELKQWTEAEEQQRLALQLQPEVGGVYVNYGQMLAKNVSEREEFLKFFKSLIILSEFFSAVAMRKRKCGLNALYNCRHWRPVSIIIMVCKVEFENKVRKFVTR